MLNQLGGDFLIIFLNYLPTLLGMTFNIIILIFGILIYKKNSFKYGMFLMLSSIMALASSITYIVIGYPTLFFRLYYELGFDVSTVNMIIVTLNFVFLSLNTLSSIFLVISLYLIYKEHSQLRVG